MIKIRVNALDSNELSLPFIERESLQELFDRFLNHQKLFPKDSEKIECFNIYINGELIPRDMWERVIPKKEAEVLIALTPQSRNFGQILSVAALLTISVYSGGIAAYFGTKLAVAAIAIGSQLLINALIPPPDTGIGGVGNQSEESQMYTISNQSNQVKKYGHVPKVYGQHRMFPYLAASPYTQIEVDKGEVIQYFYAIYDFGLGPLKIDEIKIGDTPIENYDDVDYKLVDFNRPATSEGDWDDALQTSLVLYKGDNTTENVSVNINGNKNVSGTPSSEFQVTRSADYDASGDQQELIVTLVCPQGLTTLSANAQRLARNIELDVEFREVGTTTWFPWNDTSKVSSFRSNGDSTVSQPFNVNLYIGTVSFDPTKNGKRRDGYFSSPRRISLEEMRGYTGDAWAFARFFEGNNKFWYITYSLAASMDTFNSTTFISVDTYVQAGGEIVGRIKTRQDFGNYYKYTLYSDFKRTVVVGYDLVASDGDIISDPLASYISFYGGTFPKRSGSLQYGFGGNANFLIKGNSTQPVYAQLSWKPIVSAEYEIRITRKRSFGGHSFQIVDDLQWATLQTRYDRSPITTDKRHVFLELKIKATDQLNGTVQNLNAVCTSVLDVYDDVSDTWSKEVTRNPAWVFADILTGEVNKNALPKSRLDTSSLIEFKNFAEAVPTPPPSQTFNEARFNCDFVLDFDTTLSSLINQVLSASQASLNMINGSYGILIDKQKTVPVQLFTPRNSSNFKSSRQYSHDPHALKIKYVDSYSDWNRKEAIVYQDGYDVNTATEFQELDTFAVTNFEQAWRFGRYMLAQAKLRQEEISIDVDFEHLVCTRGDLVRYQHDAMIVGGSPARVKTVDTIGKVLTIDDAFITQPLINYGYTVRSVSGISTGTLTITDSETATYVGPDPQVGDLIVWGEVSKITIDCIVKTIAPVGDLGANLTLVEYVPEIYDAESTDTLPDYDPQFSSIADSELAAPNLIETLDVLENTFRCNGNGYDYYITISYLAPIGLAVDQYEIYRDHGEGFDLVGITPSLTFEYVLSDEDFLNVEHSFKVLAVAANGAKKSLGEAISVEATPLPKTARPSDVSALYINILNETLQLDWDQITDCDVFEYQIRYSPALSGTWATSIPLQTVDRNTSLVSVQARTGTYLIKAIDFAGNFSLGAAKAITSIPSLVNLNVIESINDFPTLLGSKDRTQLFGESIILTETTGGGPTTTEYEPEGYYYFDNFLDLGEIYTVRLSSLVEAEGFTLDDMMVNWVTLSSVSALSNAQTSEWNVETQYRATDQFNAMSAWVNLTSINPISEGAQDIWTSWKKFTIGDFSGRIFQFRLKLISNVASVSPRVIDGTINADMPDRVEEFNNIIAPDTGYTVTYDPPFAGPGTTPNIQITQDNAQTGDYYTITAKTLNGFTITFYNSSDVAVSRQFDAFVKGYGRKYNVIL